MLIFGLGLLELAAIVVFFILLAVGTAFDRRGQDAPKWYVVGIFFVVAAVYFWPEYTFFGPAHVDAVMDGAKVITAAKDRVVLWPLVSQWSFWTPLFLFLGAGLVYSVIEFVLEVRRMARDYADRWARALDRKIEVYLLDDKGERTQVVGVDGKSSRAGWATKTVPARAVFSDLTDKSNAKAAEEFVDAFISNNSQRNGSFIGIVKNAEGFAPEPKINKLSLSASLGAWTFLWPAYAVSLILGDLLTELFSILADFVVNISGRFVRASFSNVFKF